MNPTPLHGQHDLRSEVDTLSLPVDQTGMVTHHTILTNPKCKVIIDIKRSQYIQIINPKSIQIEFVAPQATLSKL